MQGVPCEYAGFITYEMVIFKVITIHSEFYHIHLKPFPALKNNNYSTG